MQVVREALKANVSDKKIQQITGFSKDRIRMLRPPVVPRPASPPVVPGPPLVGPKWVGENLAANKRSEGTTPRIRIVPGGLPGLGKHRR